MNGGVNQDMEIGLPAWRSTLFAEMVYTTRYFGHSCLSFSRVECLCITSSVSNSMFLVLELTIKNTMLHFSKTSLSDCCQLLSKSLN